MAYTYDSLELRDQMLLALDDWGYANDSCGLVGTEGRVARISLQGSDFPISLPILGGELTIINPSKLFGHYILKCVPDEATDVQRYGREREVISAFKVYKDAWERHLESSKEA